MEELDRKIEEARAACDRRHKKDLKRKYGISSMETSQQLTGHRQELLLQSARNEHVKVGLQKAYASKVPEGKLEVFCVSNILYETFTKKGNSDMVAGSGIPELRRFCHSIAADAQLLEAKHFLKSKLASLFSSLDLWACTSLPPSSDDESDNISGQDESVIEALEDVEADVIHPKFRPCFADHNRY